jgi:hypothetical protein
MPIVAATSGTLSPTALLALGTNKFQPDQSFEP